MMLGFRNEPVSLGIGCWDGWMASVYFPFGRGNSTTLGVTVPAPVIVHRSCGVKIVALDMCFMFPCNMGKRSPWMWIWVMFG